MKTSGPTRDCIIIVGSSQSLKRLRKTTSTGSSPKITYQPPPKRSKITKSSNFSAPLISLDLDTIPDFLTTEVVSMYNTLSTNVTSPDATIMSSQLLDTISNQATFTRDFNHNIPKLSRLIRQKYMFKSPGQSQDNAYKDLDISAFDCVLCVCCLNKVCNALCTACWTAHMCMDCAPSKGCCNDTDCFIPIHFSITTPLGSKTKPGTQKLVGNQHIKEIMDARMTTSDSWMSALAGRVKDPANVLSVLRPGFKANYYDAEINAFLSAADPAMKKAALVTENIVRAQRLEMCAPGVRHPSKQKSLICHLCNKRLSNRIKFTGGTCSATTCTACDPPRPVVQGTNVFMTFNGSSYLNSPSGLTLTAPFH